MSNDAYENIRLIMYSNVAHLIGSVAIITLIVVTITAIIRYIMVKHVNSRFAKSLYMLRVVSIIILC